MQLEYAKYPVWANSEHTMIDLAIKWGGINEEFPFTASPTDCEAHGREIFAAAAAGQFGEVAEFVTLEGQESFPTPPSGEISTTTFE
jgi:hypothetical protein